jgi:hypothetical protein
VGQIRQINIKAPRSALSQYRNLFPFNPLVQAEAEKHYQSTLHTHTEQIVRQSKRW